MEIRSNRLSYIIQTVFMLIIAVFIVNFSIRNGWNWFYIILLVVLAVIIADTIRMYNNPVYIKIDQEQLIIYSRLFFTKKINVEDIESIEYRQNPKNKLYIRYKKGGRMVLTNSSMSSNDAEDLVDYFNFNRKKEK